MRLPDSIASALLLLSFAASAHAANVSLVGLLGGKALVSIDGGKPRTMAVGESRDGIVLKAITGQQAVFEIDGRTHRVTMGQHFATAGDSGGTQIVLQADGQGHFFTRGTINGAGVHFLVDTGATSVALSAADAKRMGINYYNAPRGQVSTANGTANAYRVKFDTIRIGDVSLNNVDGLVLESDMPYALLGMSFLNRMEMNRDGATMTLRRRY